MSDGGEEGNAAAPRGFSRRRGAVRASLDADELMALMHGLDPVRVELTRLENELRGEPLIRPLCFSMRSGRVLSQQF
ncbi:hypothetical protein ZWY2020_033301 [Hordeum vulgare]|nr:hypothetical protein ZWY2020_033301 [Hordeum vulgare]